MEGDHMAALQKEIYFFNEQTDELLSQLELLTTPRTYRRIYDLVQQAGYLNALRLRMLEIGVCEQFWHESENLTARARQFRLDVYSVVPFIIRVEGDESNAKLLQVMAENMYKCCSNIMQFKMKFGAEMALYKSQYREVVRSPSAYQTQRSSSRNASFAPAQYVYEPAQWQTQQFYQPNRRIQQAYQPIPAQMQLTRNEILQPKLEAVEPYYQVSFEKYEALEREIGLIKSRLQKLEYVSYTSTYPEAAVYPPTQKTSLASILASVTAQDIFMAIDPQKRQDLLMRLLSEQ